jgi:hypothetical protein
MDVSMHPVFKLMHRVKVVYTADVSEILIASIIKVMWVKKWFSYTN